jgi:hypothetical protein
MMAFSAKQTLPISQTCSQKYRSVDLQTIHRINFSASQRSRCGALGVTVLE